MVIDTSAVLAILLQEHDAHEYARAIEEAEVCRASAATWLEAALVADRRGDAVTARGLDLFFRKAGILIEPVTFEQVQIARQAYHDFGKGKHPAGLNFGDCLSYALARWLDEPLLFKGRDFSRTDIECAI